MNIEPLESRIAPASVAVTYTDIDGDLVKITARLPGATVPPLDVADLTFVGGGTDGQLATLTLTVPLFQNASIGFAVTKKPGGDGLANVGFIDATGRDLASVTVKGDLGKIAVGDTDTTTTALGKLSVRSMGLYGNATQGGGATNPRSTFNGPLGVLKISGDLAHANLFVLGNPLALADGKIGSVTIGGSIIGTAEDAIYAPGVIIAQGAISSAVPRISPA
jgi:hypothetical protein